MIALKKKVASSKKVAQPKKVGTPKSRSDKVGLGTTPLCREILVEKVSFKFVLKVNRWEVLMMYVPTEAIGI